MNKIKEFFNKILNYIGNFFRFLKKKVKAFFTKIGETKAYKTVSYYVGYIPNQISSRLRNNTRKALWGVIFVIPLAIGFVYFFLMPFIYTIIYSLSYVESNVGGLTYEFIGIDNYIYAFNYLAYTHIRFTKELQAPKFPHR